MPTAPVAMPVLYAAGDVPTWQVVISAALCAAATLWMARAAATIYERSILCTGSRVRLRQVLGREPVSLSCGRRTSSGRVAGWIGINGMSGTRARSSSGR